MRGQSIVLPCCESKNRTQGRPLYISMCMYVCTYDTSLLADSTFNVDHAQSRRCVIRWATRCDGTTHSINFLFNQWWQHLSMFYVLLLFLSQSFFQQAGPSSISLVAITLTIVNTDKIVSIAMHQTDTDCPSFIIMLVELRNR